MVFKNLCAFDKSSLSIGRGSRSVAVLCRKEHWNKVFNCTCPIFALVYCLTYLSYGDLSKMQFFFMGKALKINILFTSIL